MGYRHEKCIIFVNGGVALHFLPKEPYRRAAYLVFYILLGIAVLYVFFRWLFPVLLPFAIAFGAAALCHRFATVLAAKTKLSVRFWSILFVLLLFLLLTALAVTGIGIGADQLASLAGGLLGEDATWLSDVRDVLDRVGAFFAKLPIFSGEDGAALRAEIADAAIDILKNAAVSLSARIPALVGSLASFVPRALLCAAVTVLSAVYFAADYDRIAPFLREHLSARHFGTLRDAARRVGKTIFSFGKAYAILFLLTFAELLLGLTLLKQPYALLLALGIAVVDILPVLGTGTVLLPWAGYLLIAGEPRRAVGLLVLYLVITVCRQIAEPRIVGARIGLSPIPALLSMYIGLRLFGLLGLILFPLVAVIGKDAIAAVRDAKKEEA